MKIPKVFDIQKFSVHDGPGIRTIIFLKGCPMKCLWCANPESQSSETEVLIHPDKCISCGKCVAVCESNCLGDDKNAECVKCNKCAGICPSGARVLAGKDITVEQVIAEADKDVVFYQESGGGITFSGGEAMLYPDFMIQIAEHYKRQGISTAVETCGDVPWDNFRKVVPCLDLVLFDLKIMDSSRHEKFTGRPNERILENLRKTAELVETVVRVPIIPTINDSPENIEAIGEYLKSLKGKVKGVNILPYHNFGLSKYQGLNRKYELEDLKAPEDREMEEIKKKLESYGVEVKIGG